MRTAKLSDRAGRLKGRKQFPEMFSRLPLSVLMDKGLTDADVRVYAGLAAIVWQGSTAKESFQDIAELSGVSERQARRSVQALIASGAVVADKANRRGARGMFFLPSPVFGQKQGRADVVVSTPRGHRLVSVEEKVA